jgi:hypothetical protein
MGADFPHRHDQMQQFGCQVGCVALTQIGDTCHCDIAGITLQSRQNSESRKEYMPQNDNITNSEKAARPRLWISYPWVNKEERDFAYLISQLKDANIEATYDSLQLLPNVHLWERTVQRLSGIGFDGWLYILTYQCFTRKTCTDELMAAIDRIFQQMGPDFPMVGLMYDIANQQVPLNLRVRPCISLADPHWRQKISEVLNRQMPLNKKGALRNETQFNWKIHHGYCGDPAIAAVEISSTGESIQYWRIAIPKSARAIGWGQGPSGGRQITHVRMAEAAGTGKYGGHDIAWFGAANTISHGESAYAVFSAALPEFICFGSAASPFGPPTQMEIFWTAR